MRVPNVALSAWLLLAAATLAACGGDDAPQSGTDASSGRPQSGRDVGGNQDDDEDEEGDTGRELPDVGGSDTELADAGVDADGPEPADTVSADARPVPDTTGPADTAVTPDTTPADTGPTEVSPEVQEAIDNAVAASEATRDTFCACYQAGDPYNGSEAACRAELDGISVNILPCDAAIAATWPDDALLFYQCRRTVADSLNTCFTGCGGRATAILSCVPSNAIAAVGCGDGRDPAFVAAYEACHP